MGFAADRIGKIGAAGFQGPAWTGPVEGDSHPPLRERESGEGRDGGMEEAENDRLAPLGAPDPSIPATMTA